MANKTYTVSSPEGVAYAAAQTGGAAVEEGETVRLELDADTERAVVAAGWLEPEEKKKGGDK